MVTAVLVVLVLRLGYKEDITDFLPLDDNYQNALSVYEEISGGDKVIAIFMNRDTAKADPDEITLAIDDFAEIVGERDTTGMVGKMMTQVDAEQINDVMAFVYANIPYFLTETDYEHIDSIMASEDAVKRALAEDKAQLMMPSASMAAQVISSDPVVLFSNTMRKLQGSDSGMRYEMYDGYIFAPDMSRAIVTISSSFGAMESDHNANLSALLQESADAAMEMHPTVEIHLTGGPVIASNNANQIKTDSIVSVVISLVLIVALLLVVFGGFRNMMLIALSISWGWLFAVGGLSCLHNSVSIIVLGISSVIIGIAVNYPLHYLSHLQHTPDRRQALREIAAPLVVGNVTTVGAFLTLVPLQSVALRDLGLFASLMLIGTILFVLIYLPHVARSPEKRRTTFIDKWSDISLESKPAVVWAVVILTLILSIFSLRTEFDSNMGSINYMTAQQEADIEYFEREMSQTGPERKVYALATSNTADSALAINSRLRPTLQRLTDSGITSQISYCGDFICSHDEQAARLANWQKFKEKYADRLRKEISATAEVEGFADDAFDAFGEILDGEYAPKELTYFAPLTETLFIANVCADSAAGKYSIVSIIDVAEKDYEAVKSALTEAGAYAFDVENMNSTVANHLSDEFNYIGWACGLIVFFFLWLSFGSIELAMLSFVPMAISWIWILGIMGLLGIKFNIVNIILATFIFGQGDDYTIFMTEGASYEYTYRRKMLASYKSSIIVSALIMFIGIGTLIVAKHPALQSLAEVTIAGMTSVVLMAYLFPPLIFKFLISKGGKFRSRPVVLKPLLAGLWYRITQIFGCGTLCGVQFEGEMDKKKLSGAILSADNLDERTVCALRSWNKEIVLCKNSEEVKVAQRKGLLPLAEIDLAVIIAKEMGMRIAPISVFGFDEVMPMDSPCVYTGSVFVEIGEAMSIDDAAALREVCKAGREALARKFGTMAHYASFVKDRYRYKEGDIFSSACKSIDHWESEGFAETKVAVAEDGSVAINDNGYGELALLYTLAHRELRVVARMVDDERAEVLRNCLPDGVELTVVTE